MGVLVKGGCFGVGFLIPLGMGRWEGGGLVDLGVIF